MADNSSIVWNPLEYDRNKLPSYLTPYDETALSKEQKEKLEDKISCQRREDSEYLHKHPQIQAIINILLNGIYNEKPESLHEFCSKFFNRSLYTLVIEIEKELLTMSNEILARNLIFDDDTYDFVNSDKKTCETFKCSCTTCLPKISK